MVRLFRPSLVAPAVLSATLLAALLAFGNPARIVQLMLRVDHRTLAVILLLFVAYEALQYLQWHRLLRALGIEIPQRPQAFAFLIGAPAKILPIGNFFENYLLRRASCTDFGLSSSATLLSVLIEVAVALTGLVILGLGPWTWVRPLILIGLTVFLCGVWLVTRRHPARDLPSWITRQQRLQQVAHEVRQFRTGAAALLHPRVLRGAVVIGAIYLLLQGVVLYLLVRGLGSANMTFGQVLAVHFFSLAVGLIFPLPADLGVTETSGVGAFLAIGLDAHTAVSAMLLMRLLGEGTALLLAVGTALVLRSEVEAILDERGCGAAAGSSAADGLQPPG